MAQFQVFQYPLPDADGSGLDNRKDKLSIAFLPMRMKPGTSLVDTVKLSTQDWSSPEIKKKDNKPGGKDGVDAIVDAGGFFDFQVPEDSKILVKLALPSSTITDTFSNSWSSDDIISAAGNIGGDIMKGALAAVGKVVPPIFLTQYKTSEPRKFTWNFQMIPQSKNEAIMCQNIIFTFKRWCSPGSLTDIGMIEPYIVVPKIMPENSPLANMLKLFPAVIESVNVSYFDNGQVVTYTDGMPKSIQLSLQLKEMLVHTRQTLGMKGNPVGEAIMGGIKSIAGGADEGR